MRKTILSIAALLSGTVLLAAHLEPLNVKSGLWQVTMTSKINRLPAPTTSTYKSCVKKDDLNKYPFTDPEAKCRWNVVSSTSTTMEAAGTCAPEGMGKVVFKMRLQAIDPGNVQGTGEMTAHAPDGPLNGTYSGSARWVSANCPADTK